MSEAEQEIADLLVSALADDDWSVFDAARSGEPPRLATAPRALDLYEWTALPYSAIVGAAPSPFGSALAVIAEVADGLAMLAKGWPTDELRSLPLPQRGAVESLIRQQGVEEWARELGRPLALLEQHDAYEERTAANRVAPPPPLPTDADIVEDFSNAIQAYEGLVRLHHNTAHERLPHDATLREHVCLQLGPIRRRSVLMREYFESAALPVADALMGIGRACFQIAWGHRADLVFFPTKVDLRTMLARDGAHSWLMERGAVLPEWLQPDDSGED